ncbi:uncharacterized protein VP01_100g17 [Puccinia sorghi]|uniref:Ubiquitin-like domain-containing protein n=1 Tax=Puccinia sorghi TaxID=27349 RepID=A0A0L6VV34_9BASI|nr:uncharacterized protein VP01_100g17 [Puccinia sorghi]
MAVSLPVQLQISLNARLFKIFNLKDHRAFTIAHLRNTLGTSFHIFPAKIRLNLVSGRYTRDTDALFDLRASDGNSASLDVQLPPAYVLSSLSNGVISVRFLSNSSSHLLRLSRLLLPSQILPPLLLPSIAPPSPRYAPCPTSSFFWPSDPNKLTAGHLRHLVCHIYQFPTILTSFHHCTSGSSARISFANESITIHIPATDSRLFARRRPHHDDDTGGPLSPVGKHQAVDPRTPDQTYTYLSSNHCPYH